MNLTDGSIHPRGTESPGVALHKWQVSWQADTIQGRLWHKSTRSQAALTMTATMCTVTMPTQCANIKILMVAQGSGEADGPVEAVTDP